MANELTPGTNFANEPATGRMPFALGALYAVTTPIAGLAYGISAWGVYGFADKVWLLPTWLCVAAAIVADLLSLAGALATYVLRDSRLKVRAYTWGVFFGMTGLSFGAQESFAAYRQVSTSARVASGAIVIALALAVHLLIVVRRNAPTVHAEPVREQIPATVTLQHAKPTGPAPAPKSRPTTVKPRPARQAEPTGRPGRSANPNRDRWAKAVVEDGQSPSDVARKAGVSARAVQKWAESYRAEHPDLRPAAMLRRVDFDITPDQHVNGAAPEVGVSS